MNILLSGGYLQSLTSLKSILTAVGSAIGGVMLVYGGIKFAMSFRQMDQNGEHQSIYTILAGGLLVALGTIVGML